MNLFKKKDKQCKHVYNMIIIGAGSIGALKYDKYDSPKTKNTLTIAHAAVNNKQINLMAIIDVDHEKCVLAGRKWNTSTFYSIDMAKKHINMDLVDIVAVCTPTSTHYEVLAEVIIEINPRIIIAEKPFCNNKGEASIIHHLCNANNITLMVDYIRRYDSSIETIKQAIRREHIYHATVTYTRGFIHEACHAIDLMNYLLGPCKKVTICGEGHEINDREIYDPTRMIICEHNRAPVVYLPADGRQFAIFEITLMTSDGKISWIDHGKRLNVHHKEKEKTYGDYLTLSTEPLKFYTELTTALDNLITQAVIILDTGQESRAVFCSGREALEVHDVIEMYQNERRKIHE